MGYWNARNMPCLARTSGSQSVTSSPWSRTDPEVTSYSGLPNSAFANVDLPDPFGPMMAWTSPAPTVRSIPERICVSSAETWRSRTWKSGASDTPTVYEVEVVCGRAERGKANVHTGGGERLLRRRIQERDKRSRDRGRTRGATMVNAAIEVIDRDVGGKITRRLCMTLSLAIASSDQVLP